MNLFAAIKEGNIAEVKKLLKAQPVLLEAQADFDLESKQHLISNADYSQCAKVNHNKVIGIDIIFYHG